MHTMSTMAHSPSLARHLPAPRMLAPRTQALLQAPILPLLLRLSAPNLVVMLAQASTGLIERMVIAVAGGWLALRLTGTLPAMFMALGAGLLAMGAVNTIAVAAGVWFPRQPRSAP